MSHALTPVAEHKQPSQRKQTDACNRQKISCVRNNRRIIQHERSQKLRNTQQHQSQWNIYQDRQDNSFPDTGTYPLLFSGTIILSHKSKKCQAHCICRLFKKTEDLGACRIGSHIACSHIVDKCLQYHSTHCSDRIHNGNRQTFQCQSFDDHTLWFPVRFFRDQIFFPSYVVTAVKRRQNLCQNSG